MAWAAGLFEGEGSFSQRVSASRQSRVYLVMQLGSTDEDVVRKFHQIVGVGTASGPYTGKNSRLKPWWRWGAVGAAAMELAQHPAFRIHLSARREQRLNEILSAIESQPPLKSQRETITHCKREHPFDKENTLWVNNKGRRQRVCRTCNRRRQRECMQRRRERLAAIA